MNLKVNRGIIFWGASLPAFLFYHNVFANEVSATPSSGPSLCSAAKVQEILEPATEQRSSVAVRCSLTLKKTDRISKRLIIQTSKASNITIDCADALIDGGSVNGGRDMISISSAAVKDAVGNITSWDRPENVTVKNCRINGSIRVSGMALNGEGVYLRDSSHSEGHTQRAQNSAPTNINLLNLQIVAQGRTPLYVSPGVTKLTLKDSDIGGTSSGAAVYLDAESADNILQNNNFHIETGVREIMAIDGSANNRIIGNRFSGLRNGGIFLYRNCGEGGTIRHQNPKYNQIVNNVFYYKNYDGTNPSIFVASRNGNRCYCNEDDGYPFGSSADNRDFVKNTVIAQNQIYNLSPDKMIRLNDSPNLLFENKTVSTEVVQKAGCYVRNGFPSNFILDGQSVSLIMSGGAPKCDGHRYTCDNGILSIDTISCKGEFPQVVDFKCAVTGNNAGCSGVATAGTKIIAHKAGCNLEWGGVTNGDYSALPWNSLKVFRAPDEVNVGSCRVSNVDIGSGEANIASLVRFSQVQYGCREYDKNAGDCVIRGQLICK